MCESEVMSKYLYILGVFTIFGAGCMPSNQAATRNTEFCPDVCAAICSGKPEPYVPSGCPMPSCACNPGKYPLPKADEPVTPTTTQPSLPKACKRTGCGGEICADEDVVSLCKLVPEAICYQNATCERQLNGECGWTQTEELQSCLANPPALPN